MTFMKESSVFLQITIDPELKAQAQEFAEEVGLTLSALVRVCLRDVVRRKRLPQKEDSASS